MKQRFSTRRRVVGYAGVAAVVAGIPMLGTGSASATSSFEATASAYGFDYLMQNSSIAAGVSPQFSGPVAQAALTSLPSGTSFASFPYPGEVAVGVPGLIPGVVSGVPQTPAYPFIVTSGLGQGRQEINQPGISLRAQTENADAAAHAVFGTDGSGSVSDATVRSIDDRVAATAEAKHAGLSLGDQGEIATVRSFAEAIRNADGTLSRESHLEITGLRIPALQFTVPPTTPAPAPVPNAPEFPTFPAPFAGQTFEAPTLGFYDGQFTMAFPGSGSQQYAVPNDAVTQAFKQAGYDVVFTQPQQTPTGIVGATFTLHWVAPAPPDNPLYTGPTDFSLVFGRANASVGGDANAGSALPAGVVPGIGSTGAPTTGGTLPGVDSAGLGVLPGPAGTGSSLPATTTAVPTQGLLPTGDRITTAANPLDNDMLSNLYWVMVAAGFVAFLSTPTLRLLGARSR